MRIDYANFEQRVHHRSFDCNSPSEQLGTEGEYFDYFNHRGAFSLQAERVH